MNESHYSNLFSLCLLCAVRLTVVCFPHWPLLPGPRRCELISPAAPGRNTRSNIDPPPFWNYFTKSLVTFITLSGLSQELATISLRVSHPSVCSRVNTISQSKPFGPWVELLPIFCLQPSAKSHENYFSGYEFVADIISNNVPGQSVIRHTNVRLLTRRPRSVISTFLVINFSWNAKYGERN